MNSVCVTSVTKVTGYRKRQHGNLVLYLALCAMPAYLPFDLRTRERAASHLGTTNLALHIPPCGTYAPCSISDRETTTTQPWSRRGVLFMTSPTPHLAALHWTGSGRQAYRYRRQQLSPIRARHVATSIPISTSVRTSTTVAQKKLAQSHCQQP